MIYDIIKRISFRIREPSRNVIKPKLNRIIHWDIIQMDPKCLLLVGLEIHQCQQLLSIIRLKLLPIQLNWGRDRKQS